ncbi:uroporphyrinogen decarboxylase family protein [Clostridium sp. C105KSO13]|uniref:uroporphyrinogen decarboxylase family protein n=1 Tax=Clostridium sp. C105KSO13 TaxID=1776045 RepID=UPI000740726B|nr:uroporphyrinogen decarboxylase family protein [Clostridium sp. C105KSO13]CUX30117.1 methylcobalamin:coenzyme M methyltransferase [Clostridium sp. C105KSO13]
MNSRERFTATIERKPVDRPAAWLGMPDIHAQPALFEHYGVKNMHELKLAIGDDFYAVEVPYNSPTASAIYAAFDWYMDGNVDAEDRTLTADGCFKDAEELEDLDFFEWPDPEKYIDAEECKRRIEAAPKDKVRIGMMWSCHFQDTCASFGMETALMNMIANPEIYEAVDEKIMEFYLKANGIFYEATKGELDVVLIGNDMGSQRGLMLSPDMVRRFIIPGCKRLVEQAHSYGLKVIYHSCGSIVDVIPDLIEAGVDAIHPIQALAAGMEPKNLKAKFDGQVSFCGGVDTQDLLVNGSPDDVRNKVKELRSIFPTGLIISPSHEAIMPDVPPSNIHALFDEAQKVYE